MASGLASRRIQPGAGPSIKASSALDWTLAILFVWPVGGAYLDAWAHRHVPGLETFFTPWHAVLYSGVLVPAVLLGAMFLLNRARGSSWRRALPAGYGLSLVGCLLFALGGLLDLGWHLAFGIESNLSALLSPTHLVLMLSLGLIVSGPLRAAAARGGKAAAFPALVSAALLLAVFTFFAQFNNPLIEQWAAAPKPRRVSANIAQGEGVVGIILYAGLLMGVVFILLRRFKLPPGSLTLLFGSNAVFVTALVGFDKIIVLALIAGIAGDLLLWRLRPSAERTLELRVFGFGVPAFYFLVYFLGLAAANGVWWPVHLWSGSIVIAGMVGWLLSYLLVPPAAVAQPPRPA